MKVRIYLVFIITVFMFSACRNNKPNVSNIDVSVNLERFDNDLFSIDTVNAKNSISNLETKYGDFFKLYNEEIIYIGNSSSDDYIYNLGVFFNDDAVKIAKREVKEEYYSYDDINKDLSLAFKYYKYYFPDNEIPRIYSYISGFNQSLMLGNGFIGIGLEKYLGSEKKIYEELGFYKYLVKNMNRENIVPDCMKVLALGEWPFKYTKNDVLSHIIYEGIQLYFCKMMLPDVKDHLVFGFTKDELKWCSNNERQMWALLLEEKLLFSTDNFNITKLTGLSPYTSLFHPESPGKASNWLGFRIVEKYMKNKNISLKELMESEDYERILEQAKYSPR